MRTPVCFSGMYRMEGDESVLRRTSERMRGYAYTMERPMNIRTAPGHPEYRDVYTKDDVQSRKIPPCPYIQAGEVWRLLNAERFDLETGKATDKPQNYRMKKKMSKNTSTMPAQPSRRTSHSSSGFYVRERGTDWLFDGLEILALLFQPWKWGRDNDN